ncbi:MAG: GNAT family N-acetyltransferase, partial [Ferrovibrionaceae bacterium]
PESTAASTSIAFPPDIAGDLRPWLVNAGAELLWLDVPGGAVPLILAEGLRRGTWITNPLTAWCDIPEATLAAGGSTAARCSRVGLGLVRRAGAAIGLDRAVMLGHLPQSTCLPGWSRHQIEIAAGLARRRWPDRAVMLRHLDGERDAALMDLLEADGFRRLPARVVYHWPTADGSLPTASHAKRDRSLLGRAGLTRLPHAAFDLARRAEARRLYRAIYIERHGPYNPDYTEAWFDRAHETGWWEFIGLARADGTLAAFAALHQGKGALCVPALGHDPAAAREEGGYRQIVAWITEIASRRRVDFDFSSGAGDFKRRRGAVPAIEWAMVSPALTARRHPAVLLLQAAATWAAGLTPERLIALGGAADV